MRYFVIALIAITWMTFSNVGKNQFVGWDDLVYVTQNKSIELTSDNVIHSFFKGEPHGMYVPLTALSLSINHFFSGFNPAPYLYTNLLLHIFMVIASFIFLKMLFKDDWLAFFATLLFAIHPAQAEVVAYVSGRRDVLYALFFMMSLVFYLRYLQSNYSKKQLIYSLLFFTLSLLAKSQALLMPFVLLAIDQVHERKIFSKEVLKEKIGFILLAVLFGIISIVVKQQSEGFAISREVLEVPFYERIAYAFYGFILYVINVFIPVNLSLIHPYPNNGVPFIAWFSIIPVTLFVFWMGYKFMKKPNLALFGILFFILMIALMLQLFPNSYGVMNDHYLYVPLIGLAVFIVSMFYKVKNKTIPILVFSTYLIVFIFVTRQRVEVFQSGISVFTDVLKSYPDSYVGLNNRGSIYYEQGKFQQAFNDFSESIQVNSNNPYAYNNRAVLFLASGKIDEAMEDLNTAIAQRSDYADAYSNRGSAKGMRMDIKAIDDHNKAVSLAPNEGKYYYNRGAYYLQFGDKNKGCFDVQKALQLGVQKTNPMIDQICREN
ncbi:MAG: tetratricopeptide repeat protein [Bacteroidales bacterium]|nr:tetratricopeptide repeat protein [Bacteroidales bacterium]